MKQRITNKYNIDLKWTIILLYKFSITSVLTGNDTYDMVIKHVRRCDIHSLKIENFVENYFKK